MWRCRFSSFRIVVLLAASGIAAGAGRAADKPPAAKNLIEDPSFEGAVQASGLTSGWYGPFIEPGPGGEYRFEIADEGRTGQHALRLEGKGHFAVVWGEKLAIDRTQQYRARGYVRIEGDEAAAADVKLHYYAANQDYLGQSRVGWVNPRTKGWQLITVTDELDLWPKAQFIGVAVAIAGNGKASFDDIELTKEAKAKSDAPLNLVANGNMEDIAADRPGGWYISASDGNKAVCRADADVKKSGKQSLFLSADGEWACAGSVKIPVDPKKTYTLTGWAKAKKGNAHLEIGYFKDDTYLGKTSSDDVTSEEWQSRAVVSELSLYPTADKIVAIAQGEGDFAAWYDDISVTAKEAK